MSEIFSRRTADVLPGVVECEDDQKSSDYIGPMNQEITCPKCSYKFALDEALNRDIELEIRTQLSEEFKGKEDELRRQLMTEAADKADRNAAELQIKVEAQARELKEAREHERALLRKK